MLVAYLSFFPGDKKEWILPKELREISGITFIDEHTLVCVQDEKGIIFFYDLTKSEIVKQVHFGEKGDYEGIAIADNTVYVITGDGVLYEVVNYLADPEVNSYYFNLQKNEETEAMCFDPSNERLLIAIKNQKQNNGSPALFAFDVRSKKFSEQPVLQLSFENFALKKKERKNPDKLWQPSDIAIDQSNNRIFVVDGMNLRLMEFSLTGELINMERINEKSMDQPEGIAIAPDGSIYLCNDSDNKGNGKIQKFRN
jgi:uncharacterized protein YjiK